VAAKRSAGADDDHQVLPFRRRSAAVNSGNGWRPPSRAGQAAAPPVKGLAQYEGGDDSEDNYRHRMIINVVALLVIVILSIAGVWLAIQIADLRKNQDCALSGRRNCMPIDVKTLER
jgi:hypothetical protein